MKIDGYIGNLKMELEVYKIQVAIIGGPSILIYNEDRSQVLEETNPKNIKAIRKFIGHKTMKCYVAGTLNENGQIVMSKVIPNNISKEYNW